MPTPTAPAAPTAPAGSPVFHDLDPDARIERKALDFAVKAMSDAADSGPGTATLYVAVFGNRDRAGEMIAPNAFRNLDAFVKDGFYTISHNWGILPVATVTSAVQDGTGLLLEIEFHSTDEAQACRTVMRERMERGKAVKSSIGYQVIDDAHETADGETTRRLKVVDIYEASFVPVPCNEKADAVAVKGMNMVSTDAIFESKYYDSSMTCVPVDPSAAVSADAATSAIYALHSALIRGVGKALCDTDRPKADRLDDLKATFDYITAKSLRVIDALMDDANADAAGTAAKAFADLATKGIGAIDATPAPGLSTKAGRPISRANHAAMTGHVATGMDGCQLAVKAMGAMDAFLKSFAPADPDANDDEENTESHDDGKPARTKAAPPTPNHGRDREPAVAAPSFAARSERLVADFGELVKALKQQHATRAGEGRTLSAAKWAALRSQIDAAQALYAARPDAATKAAGDSPDAPDPDDVLAQYHASKSLVRATLFTSPK